MRTAAVIFVLASACAGAIESGLPCASAADCDPGEECLGGECSPGAAQNLEVNGVISVAPASQTVKQGQSAQVSLQNLASENHNVVVSCDAGATPSPAALYIRANASAQVSIAIASSAATQSFQCSAQSNTGKTLWASFSVSVSSGAPSDDFELALTPASQSVEAGSSVSFVVKTTIAAGSSEPIALAANGLPAGVTAAFSPSTVAAGASSTLTLTAAASAIASAESFEVIGTAASGTHTAAASLTVTRPVIDDFALTIDPATQSIASGAKATYTISSTVTSGAAAPIALSVSGVSGTFAATSIQAGGSTTLVISPGASGSFTVTGKSGAQTHSVSAAVQVLPPPGVGANGGNVDHLYFAVVGDTRPNAMNSLTGYPTAVIDEIYKEIETLKPQFMISTGDYMFANATAAQSQLNLYLTARKAYSGTLFAAMGNHECDGYTAHNCTLNQTVNYQAFMAGLVTPLGKSLPYYSVDIDATDASWTSKLVIIACNSWDAAQKSWLQSTLAKKTTYTLLVRHEPADARTTAPCVADVETLMTQYPYDLSIVGHTHIFEVKDKEIVVGTGGAPLASANATFGFATIEKVAGGWQVRDYDASTGLPKTTILVP